MAKKWIFYRDFVFFDHHTHDNLDKGLSLWYNIFKKYHPTEDI